jgi:ribosomal protein S18 acetylase RimI-like enzyme
MRLAAAEREAAVQMLTRAFDDDPLLRHLLPEAPARPRLLARSFRSMVRYGLVYGEVHATSAELEGVAVWLPAEYSHASLWRMARTGVLALPLTVGLGFFRRFSSYYEQIARFKDRHARRDHWYLQLLGVDPLQQRKGHASRLLAAMLNRLDDDHLPCFLDTASENNVRFYERFGFQVLEAAKVPGSEIGCWFMGRSTDG